MRRNVLKKIATSSFTKGNLDVKKVRTVAKVLKREDLRIYIKDLKNIEAKKTVKITVPVTSGLSEVKKYFIKAYPGKRIVVEIDESLLTGLRVVDYDNVYELSLKNILENAVRGTND